MPASAPTAERVSNRAWLDWLPPVSPRARAALQSLREEEESLLELDEKRLEDLARSAEGQSANADTDRLWSRILQLRLARRALTPDELVGFTKRTGEPHHRPPEIQVHRETPPLFVTLAHGWLLAGYPARALSLITFYNRAGIDDQARRFAEAEHLRIIRRFRLPDRAGELIKKKAESADPQEVALALPLVRLLTPVEAVLPLRLPDEKTDPLLVYAWWNAQVALTASGRKRALELEAGQMARARERAFQTNHLLAFDLSGAQVERQLLILGMRDYPADIIPDSIKGLFKAPNLTEYSFGDRWRALLRYNSVLRTPTGDEAGTKPPAPELARLYEAWPQAVAEWALETGELTALRAPLAGRHLLDLAYRLFLRADNVEHAFIAGLAGALARIQAGDLAEADQWLEKQVKGILEKIKQRHADIPDDAEITNSRDAWPNWSKRVRANFEQVERDLLGIVQADAANPENERKNSQAQEKNERAAAEFEAWQPWLLRYVSARFFARTHAEKPLDRLNWDFWRLHQLQGGVFNTKGTPVLPLELDMLAHTAHRRSLFDRMRRAFGLLGKAAVILLLAGAIGSFALLLYGVWLSVTGREIDGEFIGTKLIGRAAVVISAIIFGPVALLFYCLFPAEPRLWRRFQSFLAALSCFRLRIRAAPTTGSQSQAFEVALEHSRVLREGKRFVQQWAWPWQRRREPILHEELSLPSGLSPEMPAGTTRSALEEWSQVLGRKRLAFAIESDFNSAAFSWENALALLFKSAGEAKPRPPDRLPFRPYRWLAPTLTHRQASPFTRFSPVAPRESIVLVATRQWFPPLDKAWNGRASALGENWPKDLFAVHLVGQPIQTRQGIRLRTALHLARSTFQENAEATTVSNVVTAQDLPLPALPLLIVQAEPAQINRRLDSDREQARRMRTYAAEMFGGGAEAVIFVPSVSPRLAEELTSVLRRHLRRRQLSLPRLLDLTDDLRMTIAHWLGKPHNLAETENRLEKSPPTSPADFHAAMAEIAWEVTLFARSHLRHLPVVPEQSPSTPQPNTKPA